MKAEDINPGLLQAIDAAGIPHEQIKFHYSDVYVMHADFGVLAKLGQAGPWRSMAQIVRTNHEHPDAKAWPWLLDVPFACLDALVREKRRPHEARGSAASNACFGA